MATIALNNELRTELLRMVDEDQATVIEVGRKLEADEAFRNEFNRRGHRPDGSSLPWSLIEWQISPTPEVLKRLLKTNRRITGRFADIVGEFGWPGRSLVGEDGADAAWLLLQHADTEQAFRHQCIGLLHEAVRRGEADPRHLALIADRVQVVEDQHEVFGTSIIVEDDEARVVWPLLEPERVDALRHEIGMPPLYQDMHAAKEGRLLIPFGSLRTHPENQWPKQDLLTDD